MTTSKVKTAIALLGDLKAFTGTAENFFFFDRMQKETKLTKKANSFLYAGEYRLQVFAREQLVLSMSCESAGFPSHRLDIKMAMVHFSASFDNDCKIIGDDELANSELLNNAKLNFFRECQNAFMRDAKLAVSNAIDR